MRADVSAEVVGNMDLWEMDAERSGKYASILNPSKELLRPSHMQKQTRQLEKIKPRACNKT